MEVPAGYVLRLYRDPGQGGESTIIGQGLHNLAPYGWNDCVSSVSLVALDRPLITGFPGAYEHVWLHGDGLGPDLDPAGAWTMELDRGRASQLFTAVQRDFEDNRASALFVPPRFEVSLFDEPDGRGAALVLGPGMYDLGRLRFNDRVSSVRVRRMEDDE